MTTTPPFPSLETRAFLRFFPTFVASAIRRDGAIKGTAPQFRAINVFDESNWVASRLLAPSQQLTFFGCNYRFFKPDKLV